MKFTTVIISLVSTAALVAGQPHHHQHRHVKRGPDAVDIPVSTVIAYELNGTPIPATEVCDGIADGKLKWKDGVAPDGACAPSTPTPVPTTSSAPDGGQFYQKETEAAPATTAAATSSAEPSPTSAPSNSGSGSSGGSGLDSDFPDGEIDCDTFPSNYGPIPVDWLNIGSWSGIQYVTISGDVATNIDTAVSGQTCKEGAMCSYACPPGYQKSQWPPTQGATGQSIGGLKCSGGKLWLTNPGLSKKLCIPGTGNVQVQNTLDQVVSVCRTDYPGKSSYQPLEDT
jgi:SUN family beta-glucosidase